MKKILIVGGKGQIGFELCCALAPLGKIIAPDRHHLDLAKPDRIREYIDDLQPDMIINAAAYTNVDKAEEEADKAIAINGIAPGIIAEQAKKQGAILIHYSTDYVFDGKKQTPYTENDTPHPLNIYGGTKWQGEKAIQEVDGHYLILRTSWIYGARRKNFLLTILRLAREKKALKIVDDQIGAPTWSRMIAESTSDILVQLYSQYANPIDLDYISGIYHISAAGQVSWHGFAAAILEYDCQKHEQIYTKLEPIASNLNRSPAIRPIWSVFDNNKLHSCFGIYMPNWEKQLKLAMSDLYHL